MKAHFLLLLLALFPGIASAEIVFSFDADDTVEGAAQTYIVKKRESLIEIARKFDLGYNAITEANPGLDPFVPGEGAKVLIPSSWIIPEAEGTEGIVVNLSEMRLYYYFLDGRYRLVETFPIGIGSEGHNTPVGEFTIVEKLVAPAWYVPKSIREEKPELPKVVPPGPDNPLGSHALRLSERTILMHGTNRPFAVGRLASHGCLRLYPEDIPKLFALTENGTRVMIVRRPVKVGMRGDRIYIEVHRDDQAVVNYFDEAVALLRKQGLLSRIDTRKMYRAIQARTGLPTDITE